MNPCKSRRRPRNHEVSRHRKEIDLVDMGLALMGIDAVRHDIFRTLGFHSVVYCYNIYIYQHVINVLQYVTII